METVEFIATLREEGGLLADFAERAGWDADVPTCPGWRIRDLVGHVGNTHRWAAGFVSGITVPTRVSDSRPADDALGGWFRDGHRLLLAELTAAPPDRECWTFMAAPSPIAFWARRQAHETAVHRVDAEAALGHAAFRPIGTDFALDGIDELLRGFHSHPRSKARAEVPRTLLIRATDDSAAGRGWLLRLSQDPPRVEDAGSADADCVISGPAEALYLALWNRAGYEEMEVTGDDSLVGLWRESSAV